MYICIPIRGGTKDVLNEIERNLQDAMQVAYYVCMCVWYMCVCVCVYVCMLFQWFLIYMLYMLTILLYFYLFLSLYLYISILQVVRNVHFDPRMLPGGGATEIGI
jgi:hypothetical protein